jgi:hypothetical protein
LVATVTIAIARHAWCTTHKTNRTTNRTSSSQTTATETQTKATMKLSALALALLAAPIVGTTAQHGGGGGNGGSTTTKYKKMIRGADDLATTATAGPRPALPLILNADGDTTTGELVKTCASLSATGQGGCNANTSCSWCVSGAIPSACYPASMVSQLAGGVFQCDKKETTSTTTTTTFDVQHQAAEMTPAAATSSKKVQTFNLKESITLTLSSSEVDKSFCDASSPLSLAGYMNGK